MSCPNRHIQNIPTAEEYTFFSSTHRTFSQIGQILGYKTNLNKFKKIEIISGIFPDHSSVHEITNPFQEENSQICGS
jgi:hypothetical protein